MSTPSVINMTGLSIPSHEISHPQHTTTHTQPTSPTGSNDEPLSPIINCMLAGGFGGAIGDSVMHSLDTVKTRQQGSPNTIKYRNMISAYSTIFREEGLRRGLYGGYGAAMLGSFPSTAIFFGTYEGTKRLMIDTWGINETLTHLTAGFLGDFASSVVYVPSEVLKTRLQLQGQFNNPHFNSGYNYRGLTDAIKTLIAKEGAGTLFFGYKATLCRDLPFSALQFAFYEKFRDWAFFYNNLDSKKGDDLSITFELLTGAAAGGLAGSITTPLDVIKTRIQTQNPSSEPVTPSATHVKGQPVILQTGSVLKGLSIVYRTEGVSGLFSGVGPRFVWTSIQSSIMLLLYQVALRNLNDLLGNGKDQF
ncbi:hypothetical protein WICPIJ_002557 [Wickerhamomyces pijperi]|uniref:Mitochondrial carrier protein n=1 Tax=Wickerhamomyces pijperi TaxID=599730 RepID=A0A9P8QBI8_WICPI|nr:hypothetical protein WICPIJ_002557 [Wickerhamomyces pijperi]